MFLDEGQRRHRDQRLAVLWFGRFVFESHGWRGEYGVPGMAQPDRVIIEAA
jgi:hypothetical protein